MDITHITSLLGGIALLSLIHISGLDVGVCKAGAADGLHHHPDLRVFQNGIEVLDEEVCRRMSGEILGAVSYTHLLA